MKKKKSQNFICQSPLSFFTDNDWDFLCQNFPSLNEIPQTQLEDIFILLGSLEFPNLKEVLIENPDLFLMDTVLLSEKIQKLLTKYYDMELVRQEILMNKNKIACYNKKLGG